MEIVLLILVIMAAGLFILPPLVRADIEPSPSPSENLPSSSADLAARRDATYEDLADLEIDFAAGKLSETDYRDLKQIYQKDAAATLRALDALLDDSPAATKASDHENRS
ncbi:MAG: hypothetical protein ACE5HD_11305 [Acidobacteriota bacterium]